MNYPRNSWKFQLVMDKFGSYWNFQNKLGAFQILKKNNNNKNSQDILQEKINLILK